MSPPIVATSLAPVIVIVIVCVAVPSALVTENVSDRVALAASALTAELELSIVNVHTPLDTPYVPYPFVVAVPALTFVKVFSPESGSVTVGVPVAVVVLESSVTPPVFALVAIDATSLTAFTVIVIELVALLSEPSLATNVRTASAFECAALVQVIELIAVLMSAIVPLKVIVLSAVPSPAAKVRSSIPAPSVKVPL